MHWWGQQYTLCALMELQELEESETDQNDIIEIIDIWHFIMSMFQVMGMQYEDLIRDMAGDDEDIMCLFYDNDEPVVDSQEEAIALLRSRLMKVISLFPWKHWSKKSDFDHSAVLEAMDDALFAWISLAKTYDITPNQLEAVYMKKNEVNIQRQNSGTYSEATKNESDNQSIDVESTR